ncbi:MAG: Hsp33 family molecular chaperone HslO [Gammaproteobacteria bacterium]|nr:Hsp33 family molecular chaperone HslO [Gammaproteobacteria bacterium]
MASRSADTRQRFLIETCDVRGQIVHLDKTWQAAIARIDYPDTVKQVLGEAFVAASLLAGTIKYQGRMTFQVRGDGPVHLLVVQVTNDGKLRGLARFGSTPMSTNTQTVFGDRASLTITIEANEYSEPYQGIVPLEGDTLSAVLAAYFHTSEQLSTQLHLHVSDSAAAGMLLQKLPAEEQHADDADGWQRATVLADTLTSEEILSASAERLLHTLYHEEQVRLFGESSLEFHCSCSKERSDGLLVGLGEEEVMSIIEERKLVEITCEFCDAQYRYDAVDVSALFKATPGTQSSADTQH